MIRQIRFFRYLLWFLLGGCLAVVLTLGLSLSNPPVVAQTDIGPEGALIKQVDPVEEEDNAENKKPEGLRPFAALTENLNKQEGLFTLYSDLQKGKAYLALRPDQINQNFLLAATLESGVGEAGLLRGWPINDLLIQFREAPGDRLQVVVPNIYFRNPEGQSWQQRLLDGSFSDSVIFAVNIVSIDPDSQAKLIDLSNLIMERDLVNLSQALGWVLGSYSRNPDLSRIRSLKAFPQNLEIDTRLSFTGGGAPADPFAALFGFSLQGLPDNRGFTLGIRYSFMALPENNGYQPRLADERVGYFLSVFRAPLQARQSDPFVRYINRWHLEKQTPEAELSAPKAPIVFWIENTVPPEYRDALRQGALLWNEAFERAGFKDAVVVQQMPDNAHWDPSDVRYNVIRWSDSLSPAAIGLGPSRANPLTGEILDADIIIDANAIRWLQQTYQERGLENTPEMAYLQLCGERSQAWYLQWLALQQSGEAGLEMARSLPDQLGERSFQQLPDDYCAGYVGGQQTAFGALAVSTTSSSLRGAQLEAYIQQYLVALTAHEVGHTLGLRHNFAGSRYLSPDQLNNPEITRSQGLVSSIMDYFPPNVAPPGAEQGDFFPTRLGPYDIWAIEYGYRPATPSPVRQEEQRILDQILSRSPAPELAYATDEDIFDFIDPEVDAWDLSNDPLQFATWQLDNARAVWQRLNRLSVSPGEGYGSLRRRVDLVFNYFRNNTLTLTNYIGGQSFRRLDPWETADQMPLEPIPAEKQREALAVLNERVFAPDAFQFSPQLLNQLPPDRWLHWGMPFTTQLDYPIYERVLLVQSLALSDLMFSDRLARVRDMEFKTTQADVLTIAELFESLYQSVWSEITTPGETGPQVSSLRRGLQRHHLNMLTNLVLRRSLQDALSVQSFTDFMALAVTLEAPEDARVLARYQLRQMAQDADDALSRYGERMEVTTRAHLEDVRDRIEQVLNASLIGT